MTKDEIIRMADEAKLIAVMEMFEEEVIRFAELVRQHTQIEQMPKFEELTRLVREDEREACAKVCDELAALNRSLPADSMWQWGECAAAIRARKNHE